MDIDGEKIENTLEEFDNMNILDIKTEHGEKKIGLTDKFHEVNKEILNKYPDIRLTGQILLILDQFYPTDPEYKELKKKHHILFRCLEGFKKLEDDKDE